MIDIAMIMACAPNVHPSTIQQIIKIESEGNPIAININHKNGVRLRPKFKIQTAQHAAYVARAAMQLGHTVDIGYMQVNSANLKMLGLTVEEAFDHCKNIEAGGKIFTAAYVSALAIYKNEQAALRAALSAYNTGNFRRGFENGYVAKYLRR